MTNLVLVDTSVFIDFFRGKGTGALELLILNNLVLLSPIVRLELLAGTRKREAKIVDSVIKALREIDSFPSPQEAAQVLLRARGSGLLGGIPDILILADTIRSKAKLFTTDQKLAALARRLKVPLFN